MKYVLKQKLISFGDDFDVLDENGNKAFYFDSKIGGFLKRIIVLSPSGEKLAVIRKKFFSIRPTFLIKKNGQEIARVFKKLFSIRKSFVIKTTNANDFNIIGSFSEHSYQFYHKKEQVAEVSKKWFRSKDTYGIDIQNPDDVLVVLSAAVIIDIICHPGRDSSF